CARRGAFFDSW
nr:immunoglobulin heavy chain junction region [Macaca mulatta]